MDASHPRCIQPFKRDKKEFPVSIFLSPQSEISLFVPFPRFLRVSVRLTTNQTLPKWVVVQKIDRWRKNEDCRSIPYFQMLAFPYSVRTMPLHEPFVFIFFFVPSISLRGPPPCRSKGMKNERKRSKCMQVYPK